MWDSWFAILELYTEERKDVAKKKQKKIWKPQPNSW